MRIRGCNLGGTDSRARASGGGAAGAGAGAGGRIKEERRELTPTRQHTLSIIKFGAVCRSRTVSCTLDS